MVLPSRDETCPRLLCRTTDIQFHDFDLLELGVELFFQSRQCRFARVRLRRKLEGMANGGAISVMVQRFEDDFHFHHSPPHHRANERRGGPDGPQPGTVSRKKNSIETRL